MPVLSFGEGKSWPIRNAISHCPLDNENEYATQEIPREAEFAGSSQRNSNWIETDSHCVNRHDNAYVRLTSNIVQ